MALEALAELSELVAELVVVLAKPPRLLELDAGTLKLSLASSSSAVR